MGKDGNAVGNVVGNELSRNGGVTVVMASLLPDGGVTVVAGWRTSGGGTIRQIWENCRSWRTCGSAARKNTRNAGLGRTRLDIVRETWES